MTIAGLSGPLDQLLDRFEVAQRGEPERCTAPAGFDLGDHVFRSLFISSDHQDISAACSQRYGRSPTDTARRARDQRCLAS